MQANNAEVMDLLDARHAFEFYVGGKRVDGPNGLLGSLAAMKEILHGNPDGAVEGEFTVKVRARMDESPEGYPVLRIVSEDLVSFCPDNTTKERKLIVVQGNPMADRRNAPRAEDAAEQPKSVRNRSTHLRALPSAASLATSAAAVLASVAETLTPVLG